MLAKKYKVTGQVKDDFFVDVPAWNFSWGRAFFRVDEKILAVGRVQIALVAPKKVFKRSVERHRAKRRLARELAVLIKAGKIGGGKVVFVVNERILTLKPVKIRHDLEFFARRKLPRQSA